MDDGNIGKTDIEVEYIDEKRITIEPEMQFTGINRLWIEAVGLGFVDSNEFPPSKRFDQELLNGFFQILVL